jgi:iron complex transport system permease protein
MKSSWLVLRSSRLNISYRFNRRVPLVLLILGMIAVVAIAINLSVGDYPIPFLAVLKTILGLETENPDYAFILHELRLPRTLVAFLVGIALAISGTLLQGLTRNPLAAPEIIGFNAGASLAAVSLIVLLPKMPLFFLPLAAFGGAIVVTILVYLLAWNQGSSPLRLILIGIGITAFANAFTTLAITYGDINSVSQAMIWLVGSVYGRTWEHLNTLLPWLVILIPLAYSNTRQIDALNLGDDVAKSLGLKIEWQRSLLLLISAALCGVSVATAGTVGFVGLMAPHLGRQLVGPTYQGLLPTAALIGGILVVVADLLGRSLFSPIQIPCGVITAAIGAPYFIYLLVRSRSM